MSAVQHPLVSGVIPQTHIRNAPSEVGGASTSSTAIPGRTPGLKAATSTPAQSQFHSGGGVNIAAPVNFKRERGGERKLPPSQRLKRVRRAPERFTEAISPAESQALRQALENSTALTKLEFKEIPRLKFCSIVMLKSNMAAFVRASSL